MTYQILSRKWRPQTFAEVVGQEHVTRTLTNAIAANRLAQAYLFSGPRGVGKTTTARILAKALNCTAAPGPTATPCGQCPSCVDITAGTSVDVLEIDGASNTGVDDIRELREQVKYVPLQGRYKIYIIDEVHMLSNAAFNALLKTLEEPPPHLLFIFATTESQKILPTILSRCQHFRFKRVGRVAMIAQLKRIAGDEGIRISDQAFSLVAKVSEGSVRDALSAIDQVVAYGGPEVCEEDVAAMLGVVDRQGFAALTATIREKDAGRAIAAVRSLLDHGHDVKLLCADLVEYVRNLTVIKLGGDPTTVVDLPKDDVEELAAAAARYELDELQRLFGIFSQAQEEIRFAFSPPFTLEMALVKATRVVALEPIEYLVERVEALRSESPQPQLQPRSPAPPPSSHRPSGPRRQSPPPAEPAASSPPVVPGIEQGWRDIVKRVMEEKPNLGSYLEAGRLTLNGSDEVVLEYDATHAVFGEMVAKDEHRAYLGRLLRELCGREMAFRVRALPAAARREKERQLPAPKSSRGEFVADIVAHPTVQEVLDVFGGEVMEVRETKRLT